MRRHFQQGEILFRQGDPSDHVLALLGWRTHRLLGVLFGVYCGIILIGSVHLGWHYAIDGYVGIAVSYALWRCVGWWLARSAPSAVWVGS